MFILIAHRNSMVLFNFSLIHDFSLNGNGLSCFELRGNAWRCGIVVLVVGRKPALFYASIGFGKEP